MHLQPSKCFRWPSIIIIFACIFGTIEQIQQSPPNQALIADLVIAIDFRNNDFFTDPAVEVPISFIRQLVKKIGASISPNGIHVAVVELKENYTRTTLPLKEGDSIAAFHNPSNLPENGSQTTNFSRFENWELVDKIYEEVFEKSSGTRDGDRLDAPDLVILFSAQTQRSDYELWIDRAEEFSSEMLAGGADVVVVVPSNGFRPTCTFMCFGYVTSAVQVQQELANYVFGTASDVKTLGNLVEQTAQRLTDMLTGCAYTKIISACYFDDHTGACVADRHYFIDANVPKRIRQKYCPENVTVDCSKTGIPNQCQIECEQISEWSQECDDENYLNLRMRQNASRVVYEKCLKFGGNFFNNTKKLCSSEQQQEQKKRKQTTTQTQAQVPVWAVLLAAVIVGVLAGLITALICSKRNTNRLDAEKNQVASATITSTTGSVNAKGQSKVTNRNAFPGQGRSSPGSPKGQGSSVRAESKRGHSSLNSGKSSSAGAGSFKSPRSLTKTTANQGLEPPPAMFLPSSISTVPTDETQVPASTGESNRTGSKMLNMGQKND